MMQETPVGLFEYEFYFHKGEEACRIIRYLGAGEQIVFPSTINGRPVRAIGKDDSSGSIFKWNTKAKQTLRKLILPASVKRIEAMGLAFCKNLEEIVLPEGIRVIGSFAFARCGMKEVTIPSSIVRLGMCAFYKCGNLEEVHFPDKFFHIGYSPFKESKLFHDYIRNHGHLYFGGCIVYNADHACGTLRGEDYFYNYEVLIRPGTVSLNEGLFMNARHFYRVMIPDSVVLIGKMAFFNTSLTEVIIPPSVKLIEDYAFGYSCAGANAGDTVSPSDHFREHLSKMPFRILGIAGTEAERYARDNGFEFEEINLWKGFIYGETNGINCIKKYAGSSSKLTIPSAINGTAIEGIRMEAFEVNNNITGVVIENGIKEIFSRAFHCCERLEEVVFPDYANIAPLALRGCTAVRKITLGKNNQLAREAFSRLYSLEQICFPKGALVGAEAFYACRNLKSVVFSEDTVLTADTFLLCESLVYVEEKNCPLSLNLSHFQKTPWLKNRKYGVCYMDELAIGYKGKPRDNTKLKIKAGTKRISNEAFIRKVQIISVSLPEGLEKIGKRAFCECVFLEHILFPDSIRYIGEEAFLHTEWYAKQPDGLIIIGSVLYTCKGNLKPETELMVPSEVRIISEGAFAKQNGLVKIHLHHEIEWIGNGAFRECHHLRCVYTGNAYAAAYCRQNHLHYIETISESSLNASLTEPTR